MSATTITPPPIPPAGGTAAPRGTARLLVPGVSPGLAAHLARWGPMPARPDLLADAAAAGLRGRGGAGFPTAVKLAATRSSGGLGGRSPVVVANGCEGEPASAKDRTLLGRSPHLVLDGITAASDAVRATRAILCVEAGRDRLWKTIDAALAERRDRTPIELHAVPSRYVAGQASALVNWLDHAIARPTTVPPRLAERGVGGRPTLVDNVETLADLALVARFGAAWWRRLGTPSEPGTALVTVSGAVLHPGVVEVTWGDPLAGVLARAGAAPTSGVLVGGYFGTWLTPQQAASTRWSRADLARFGAEPGCGVVAVMPLGACPLEDVARVSRWLASQSAGQCGACHHGLPALAGAWESVAAPTGARQLDGARANIGRWSEMVRGRGACGLPDGAATFAASALRVFADHIELHRVHGRCRLEARAPVLPLPFDDRRGGTER